MLEVNDISTPIELPMKQIAEFCQRVVGSRPDIANSQEHARNLRQDAENRLY
jgi:hypothetical protein